MRRRKPKVVWLPPTNANSINGDVNSGIHEFIIDAASNQPTNAEIPLVIDADDDPLDSTTTSLSDIENSAYRLRRIVGKIFVSVNQLADATVAKAFIVTAGLMVRRSDPATGQSLALIGAGSLNFIGPQELRNYGDPWIWRRSWTVYNNLSTGQPGVPDGNPTNSAHGPAVADGPHVDQKTARIISSEERLFLDVEVAPIGLVGDQVNTELIVLADLRVLASMRPSQGNRRNASR